MDHVAVRSDRPILDHDALRVELDHQIRRCVRPDRGAGADQPKMVEQRAVKRRVEEMISQNVLLSQAANGKVCRVIVAHRQSAVLAPGYEPVHSAAVDLMLLLEGAIHDVAGLLVRWDVPGGIIRRDWQVWRKPGIEDGRILRRIERLWKCCVRRSVLLHLPDSLTRVGDAIRARKHAVQTVVPSGMWWELA